MRLRDIVEREAGISAEDRVVFHPAVETIAILWNGFQGDALAKTDRPAFGDRAGIAVVGINIDPAADRFEDGSVCPVIAYIIRHKLRIGGNDPVVQRPALEDKSVVGRRREQDIAALLDNPAPVYTAAVIGRGIYLYEIA